MPLSAGGIVARRPRFDVVAIAHVVVAQDVAAASMLLFLYAFPKFEYTRFSHSVEPKADFHLSLQRTTPPYVGRTRKKRTLYAH